MCGTHQRGQCLRNFLPSRYSGLIACDHLRTDLLCDIDWSMGAMLLLDEQCHSESFFLASHLTIARR